MAAEKHLDGRLSFNEKRIPVENPPPDIVTWAEVHALQEEAERLGLIAHLSSAHGFRYQAALRRVSEFRTAYEERKQAEREQEERAAKRRVLEANLAEARRVRSRKVEERRKLADALAAITGQAAS